METIRLTKPDDWHCHLRDGDALKLTVAHTERQFARAIIMPNLRPPIQTVEDALAYREAILRHSHTDFTPLMTLYLTENTTPEAVIAAAKAGITAFKLYPAGATTHSEAGIADLDQLYPVLEALESVDLPLLLHGEVSDPAIDIFDREAVFIDRYAAPWAKRFPNLRLVLEHVSTAYGVDFVRSARDGVAATITAHHLLLNRNDLLAGGLRPDHYCLPILKRDTDQAALIMAATSGDPKFFLGTDSAPHPKGNKYTACGCAGIYTAHAAVECYVEAFEKAGALEKLNDFASTFGAKFYKLPQNTQTLTLHKKTQTVPESFPFGDAALIPFKAGHTLNWTIDYENHE